MKIICNFSTIHQGHVVHSNDMRAPVVLTGYETMVAIKAGGKFAINAIEEGVVKEVTSSSITVEYKTKGKQTYKLYKWTSKEESETCYTHELVTSLEPGTKFIKDDTIAYDKLFFEPCIFEPRRVIYKQGTMVNVMFSEDSETWEDSVILSSDLSDRLGTVVTKVKSAIHNKDEHLVNLIDIGNKVNPNTTLFTILASDIQVGNLKDDKALSILKDLGAVSKKADTQGIVDKIVVYYNFDIKDPSISPSVRKLIEYSDKVLLKNYGYTGKVNSGYSIQGIPLQPDQFVIKIYITVNEKMGKGDKYILSNQVKCTVGEVFDYKLTTESGRNIDCVFSYRSVIARIVNSVSLNGTTSALIDKIEKNVIDMYFK